jgi:hypothetical protein
VSVNYLVEEGLLEPYFDPILDEVVEIGWSAKGIV